MMAAFLAASSTCANAQEDAGRVLADWRNIKKTCSELKPAETLQCVYFVSGFIESMRFQEHQFGLEPQCIGPANLESLGNNVIKRIRSDANNDWWTGPYLALIVLKEANCRYDKMTSPPGLPRK